MIVAQKDLPRETRDIIKQSNSLSRQSYVNFLDRFKKDNIEEDNHDHHGHDHDHDQDEKNPKKRVRGYENDAIKD